MPRKETGTSLTHALVADTNATSAAFASFRARISTSAGERTSVASE
jgi:hypothetical protein